VYRAKIKGQEFVVKEALLTSEEKLNVEASRGKTLVVKNSYPEEFRIMSLLNNSIYSKQCPNFLLAYNLAVCEGCKLPNAKPGSCFISFLEPANGDLSTFDGILTDEIAKSMLYQLFAALSCVHTVYGIFHSDIKQENVLVQKIKPGGYFEYNINGKTYYVKNVGYVFFLNDFGLSQVFKPTFSKQTFYGTRNARVTDDEKLAAITCRYSANFSSYKTPASLAAAEPIKWKDGQLGTNNKFGVVNIVPLEVVNLENTREYPPFEFFLDVQDLLLMCVSGSSPTQRYPHRGLNGLSIEFIETLRGYVRESFPYTANAAKFIRSDIMLSDLYEMFERDSASNYEPILESFTFN